jgi:hypothetical protein
VRGLLNLSQLGITLLPCVAVAILAMATHKEGGRELMLKVLAELLKGKNKRWKAVKGDKLKCLLEEVLSKKELEKVILNLEKDLIKTNIAISPEAEHYIRDAIINAGIDIEKHGGWHRCLAAYLILPRINVLTILADAKQSAEIDFRNRVVLEAAEKSVRAILKEMNKGSNKK